MWPRYRGEAPACRQSRLSITAAPRPSLAHAWLRSFYCHCRSGVGQKWNTRTRRKSHIGMNSRLLASCILVSGFTLLPVRADSARPNEDETVKLTPYVVEAKSLANAGFTFKAK